MPDDVLGGELGVPALPAAGGEDRGRRATTTEDGPGPGHDRPAQDVVLRLMPLREWLGPYRRAWVPPG